MKVLIIGGSGMLGHKLYQVFKSEFETWVTLRNSASKFSSLNLFDENRVFENIDVTKFHLVAEVIDSLKPDIVVNAVGVIKQKSDATDTIKNIEINALFPHKVANVVNSINSRFITLSTDCVFDGMKGNYNESDLPNAKDLYGKSKHLGEVVDGHSLTIRTSIIGRELNTNKSLVEWFLSNNGKSVRGYSKAIYSGFPTIVLAKILVDIIKNKHGINGLYHLSSNPINKYDLLNLIKKKLDLNINIDNFVDFKIDRSLDSTKYRNVASFIPNDWKQLVGEMFDDPTPYSIWRKYLKNRNTVKL